LRTQLVTGLHLRLGEPRLFDELRLKLAGRDRRATGELPSNPRRRAVLPARAASQPATGASRERIVRESATVDDDELRELIARVRITHDR